MIIKQQHIPKDTPKLNQQNRLIDDGFSSQEQIQHQEIQVEAVKKQQEIPIRKQQVRFKIPPPQEITDKNYSLRPDIQTGWQAKQNLPNPIPIMFESDRYDQLIRRMLKHPRPKVKLVYLGPRYQNTYYSWYDKDFPFPYHHIKAPNDMKFTNRPFCGQHWQAEDELLFDSFFQGGNLDSVMKVGERQYDCFMRVDSNTAGHLQWFNFRVKGWKKLLKYKINICNFKKDKCLFSRGMKPYIYSLQREKKQKIGWQQDGECVRFERRFWAASKVYELQIAPTYRLSFQYYTTYEDDQIRIAYCIPYTYTQLTNFVTKLKIKAQSKNYLKVDSLCNSLGGLQLPLLTIHQGLEQTGDVQYGISKRCVVISGRAHPGQSNGSHMMQGFLEWLCGQSKSAQILRQYIVFKIVPMLNPDGVALGNYRTGLSGRDFNRQYCYPQKSMFPQVYNFKKLVADSKALYGDRLLMFLDFHGHSTKKNTFVYGPEFPIIDRFYYQSRLFPKLIGNMTSMFRYYSCIFRISELKQTTARAVVLKKINIPLSYTIQTSNGSYFDYEALKDVPYTLQKWKDMGNKIGMAMFEYFNLLLGVERNRLQKIKLKRKDKQKEKEKQGRKSFSASKKVSHHRSERMSIFSHLQDQKIKSLLDQIKKAEEEKSANKVSDDEMSEGSSDKQAQEDDLSPVRASYLKKVIHSNEFQQPQPSRIKTKTKGEQNSTENRSQVLHFSRKQQQVVQDQNQNFSSEQVFARKKIINIRKPVVSKERISIQSVQKKVATAKIINFSFCDQSPRRASKYSVDKNRPWLPSKLNFLQLVAGKWSEERSQQVKQSSCKQQAVMDLSDPHFRTTFTLNIREGFNNQRLVQPKIIPIQNKRGRFDQYKYRRLLLNNNDKDSP